MERRQNDYRGIHNNGSDFCLLGFDGKFVETLKPNHKGKGKSWNARKRNGRNGHRQLVSLKDTRAH